MKKIYFILFSLCLISSSSFATTITAEKSGAWDNSATWNVNNWTSDKDTVIIPFGIIVTINSNIDLNSLTVFIQDNGIISFIGGGSKLALGAGSKVQVGYSGLITASGSPSQVLKIGGNTVFQGNQPNIVGFSYATSTTTGFIFTAVLPVRFLSFTATGENGNARLVWTTADQTAADRFEIETSPNGSTWTITGSVAAKDQSAATASYSMILPNSGSQKTYYRIREVDQSGHFVYSSIQVISHSATGTTVATSGNGNLVLFFPSSVNGKVLVRLVSLNGQVVSSQYLNQPSGQVVISTSLKGIYLVCTENNGVTSNCGKILL